MVQWLDNELGRLVCEIENGADQLGNRTTILFIGDNGTRGCKETDSDPTCLQVSAIADPFERTHGKGTMYEGGLNVPFIVKSPEIPLALEGSTSDVLVTATDMMATLADLSGKALPADPNSLLDTVSVVPYLYGQRDSVRQFSYAERFPENFIPDDFGQPTGQYRLSWHWQALRDVEGYKLIRRTFKNAGSILDEEELYYLPADPHEDTDLIHSTATDDVLARDRLRAELTARYPHLVQ